MGPKHIFYIDNENVPNFVPYIKGYAEFGDAVVVLVHKGCPMFPAALDWCIGLGMVINQVPVHCTVKQSMDNQLSFILGHYATRYPDSHHYIVSEDGGFQDLPFLVWEHGGLCTHLRSFSAEGLSIVLLKYNIGQSHHEKVLSLCKQHDWMGLNALVGKFPCDQSKVYHAIKEAYLSCEAAT